MIFAAVVAAFALVACNKEVKRSCYRVEYILPAQAMVIDADGDTVREARPEMDYVVYKWASEAEIDAYRKNYEAMGYKNVLTTSSFEGSEKVKTMADCMNMGVE